MRPFHLLAPLVVTLVAGCQADAPVALDPDPMAATIVAADVEAAALEAARAAVLTVAPSASMVTSGGVDLVAGAIENPRAVASSPSPSSSPRPRTPRPAATSPASAPTPSPSSATRAPAT